MSAASEALPQAAVRPRDIAEFVLLAAAWGAASMFLRVAAPEFGPAPLMLVRCVLATVTLLPLLRVAGLWTDIRGHWRPLVVLGMMNSALPFVLLGYAALEISAGQLSILTATTPVWAALIAYLWLGEHLTLGQAAGLLLGLVGVGLLVGIGTGAAVAVALVPVALALAATLAYAASATFTRRFLATSNPLANALGSQISAAGWLLLPGVMLWPAQPPGGHAWLSAALLAAVSTGAAYFVFFRLLARLGATRTIAVTYLIPVFGVLWGWWFLDEPVTLRMVGGGLVILLGTALATRTLRLPRLRVYG